MGTDWLEKVEMLKALSENERLDLSQYIEEKAYKAGQKLYEQDGEGGSLYFIKSGKVRVFRKGKAVKEHELATMGEGSVFGEMTFFDKGKHTASIAILDEAVVGLLSIEQFERMAKENSTLAYLVTKSLLFELQKIMRTMNKQYVSLMDYMHVFGK